MNQKKYIDIPRIKEKYFNTFSKGEKVVIQVKLDGSNSSFTYDPSTEEIVSFSRKTQLTPTNNLRGFYELIRKLNSAIVKSITENGRYVIFGEYLIPHTISYCSEMYNKFYMFDIWDNKTEEYLPFEKARVIYKNFLDLISLTDIANNFQCIPVLYVGNFESWEKIMEYLKENPVNAKPMSEGIVIKSQDRLDNKNSNTPAYVKIVNERFSEVHDAKPKKPVDPAILAARAEAKERASTIVTKRRIEKVLEKAVDNGELRVDWDEKDMGWIVKNVPKAIYEDCVKEENDVVVQCENFGKICGSLVMEIVREMLKTR